MRWLKTTTTAATNSSPMTTTAVADSIRSPTNMRATETVGGAVAPAPAKFKILKRPSPLVNTGAAPAPSPFDDDPVTGVTPGSTSSSSASSVNNSGVDASILQTRGDPSATGKQRAPVKTLEQRKQEYAEARLRILGDAKFSDDDDDEEAATTTTNTAIKSPQTASVNEGRTSGGNNRNNVGRGNRPSGGGGGGQQPNLNQPPPRMPFFNASVPPPQFDPVIRVPRGPDGTVGFQGRR